MKTIIITGANGNLGTAVTQKFLDSGYQVVATVVSEADKAAMPKHEQLDTRVVNLTDPQESEALVQGAIAQYKQVHGAVMLVGGYAGGNIEKTAVADINKLMMLNFETAYNVTRPLLTHLQEMNYGKLVYIGARPALNPAEGKANIAYALSKSLLFRLAEFINAGAKKTNITATVVAPSTLDTPLNRKNMPDTDPAVWVKPEQLAEILEFVCGDKSDVLRETVLKVYNNA